MTDVTTLRTVLSDADLILATRAGDGDAYGELYVRHLQSARAAAKALSRSRSDADDIVAESFSRVLSVLQRGGGPEVSFRPYLLATVRNSFYERVRKVRLDDTIEQPEETVDVALLDLSASEDDRTLVAAAFASLPERWQLVLWHTEVEGRSAAEVAPLLGLAPNAVAALAYRAREGLREAYLQSHLHQPMAEGCQACVANLGAYVRDGLSARDRRAVDEHLQTCTTCPALLAELSDANRRLRAVLIPFIVGVPAAKYLAGLGASKGLIGSLRRMPRSQQTMVGSIAASMMVALVLVGVAVTDNDDTNRIVGADSAAIDDSFAPSSTARPIATSSSRPANSTTNDDDVDDDSISDLFDEIEPFDTGEATPSNTLPATADTVDILTMPPTDGVGSDSPAIPYIPSYVPPSGPRTTPNTQPRTTPTSRASNPPATQPTVGATYPTVQPTDPTTPESSSSSTDAPTTSSTVAPPAPPSPRVGLEQPVVRRAYNNGSTVVRVNAGNGEPSGAGSLRPAGVLSPAADVRMTLPVPAGVSFVAASNPEWECQLAGGAVVCDLPDLAEGATTSADIRLAVGDAVVDIALTPMIDATGADRYTAPTPLTIPVSRITGAISAEYDTGRILTVGNSSMTCNPTTPTCNAARVAAPPPSSNSELNRQRYPMIGVGADGNILNRSSATITLPTPTGGATVSKAFLVWSGQTDVPFEGAPDAAGTARLVVGSGAVQDVTAATVHRFADDPSAFSAWADVTAQVAGQSGEVDVTVSDLRFATSVGSFGGWSLVVLTHEPALPERLLVVSIANLTFGGSQPASVGVSIPLDASTADQAASLAIIAAEGDRSNIDDAVTIGNDAPIPNAFSSTIDSGPRAPDYANNFGFDLRTYVGAAAAGATDRLFSVLASTADAGSDDLVRLVALTFAIDVPAAG